MTRVNVVPVDTLSREHLIAEYREITRLPNNLKKSLSRKSKPFSKSEIPTDYVLGTGHVKFFYDKMLFLETRFGQLISEMVSRGYSPKYTDVSIFKDCPKDYYNDYIVTQNALLLNQQRINERTGSA